VSEIVAQVDGRRLRREQNRETVVDALVELFEEGDYTPSSATIAARAGISARSLFRYFDDIDDLNRAAIDRHIAANRHLFEPHVDATLPTAAKIDAFVEARVCLHEAVAPGARAARLCAHRHPVVAAQLLETRTFLREQVQRVFASELTGPRMALLPALDELCSFEAYEFLRHGHRMSRAKATAALVAALTTLLDPKEGAS
jgi:AcrR family transcriptional regulator